MKMIGIFYAKSTFKTAEVANMIQKALGEEKAELIAVEDAWKNEFDKYKYIIAGTSTWFDGELPDYWDELIPELRTLNLKGKKVAIFGLGNQTEYPDNFVDGIGLLAEAFKEAGAVITGFTSTEGYSYNKSLAEVNGMFEGLALDMDNEPGKAESKIREWVKDLMIEFK